VLAAHQQMKAIIIASIKGDIYNREKGETLGVDILIIIIKIKKNSLAVNGIIYGMQTMVVFGVLDAKNLSHSLLYGMQKNKHKEN